MWCTRSSARRPSHGMSASSWTRTATASWIRASGSSMRRRVGCWPTKSSAASRWYALSFCEGGPRERECTRPIASLARRAGQLSCRRRATRWRVAAARLADVAGGCGRGGPGGCGCHRGPKGAQAGDDRARRRLLSFRRRAAAKADACLGVCGGAEAGRRARPRPYLPARRAIAVARRSWCSAAGAGSRNGPADRDGARAHGDGRIARSPASRSPRANRRHPGSTRRS